MRFPCDQDGFYWYAGQSGDMLNPGGIWMSPLKVENILLTHSFVDEAAVVAMGNESGLDKQVVFVVLKNSDVQPEEMEKELREFVRSKRYRYNCPQLFHSMKGKI